MQKTEWPTSDHLEALRKRGQVSYSSVATRSALLMGIVLFIWGSASILQEMFVGFATLESLDQVTLHELLRTLMLNLTAFSALVLFIILGLGLLQTRGLLVLNLLAPRIGRLFHLRRAVSSAPLSQVLGYLVLQLTALLVGIVSFYLLTARVLVVLNIGSSSLSWSTFADLRSLVPLVIFAGSALALVSYGLEWYRFRHANMMSRMELEAESES